MSDTIVPLVRPFRALRPAAGRAGEVAAPPYDVLSSAEARVLAEGRPWSFLHVSKPEIDLPVSADPYGPAVYEKARENFVHAQAEGVLCRDAKPGYYVYRQVAGDHEQTGIVAATSVGAYDEGRIAKHEHTQPKKESGRVHQIEAINAHTGPVMMAYPPNAALAAVTHAVVAREPDVDLELDGVRHVIWPVWDTDSLATIGAAFEGMERVYIADGHHRSAAAARVAEGRRGPGVPADAPHEFFLSVLFPAGQLRILDYNRLVRDLNGASPEQFLARVGERFSVEQAAAPVAPGGARCFGMYLGGQWYALGLTQEHVPTRDPVRRLDVSLLADNLIAPLLGIEDQRRDPRIDFVGGSRGLGELERRVDSGEMAVAFSFYPTSVEDLIGVADAGEVMPTKSTWFDPKLADGLVSYVMD